MIATNPPPDGSNLVDPAHACPRCGERDADELVWIGDDGERVECQGCGTVYEPGAAKGGTDDYP
jgi:uncharacterized OB-fold protein